MKRFYTALVAAILLGASIQPAAAALQVSVDFFHDNLEAYGDWREVGDYGYVWQPRDVDRDWRPYSNGRWLYTDAGWTWDSDEPYSWAVYHYGRWARVDRVGWVWVPGTEWGPAWVSWRRSERHVGWAPLPPEARFSRDTGFGFGVDVDFDIGPANYRFILARDFGEQRLRRHYIEPRQNISIINQTTNITNITYVNNVVYNQGPRYDTISRQSAQPIRRLKLDRREDLSGTQGAARAGQMKSKVQGDSYQVMAPSFDAKPATAPRKLAAKVEKPEVNHGWKNVGSPAAVEKLRKKIKSEPAPAAEVPPPQKTDVVAEPPTPAPDKVKDDNKPPKPAAPGKPEVVPGTPEKPTAPEKPAKPGRPEKGAKPVKPEPSDLQLSPPVNEQTVPPAKPLKSKGKATPRPKTDAPPKVNVPERNPVSEDIKPPRREPPVRVERAQPEQTNERPKAAPVRKPERIAPSKPEPRPKAGRPEPRKPSAPDAAPAQPAKEKGKGKKKNGEKPEEAPQ